MFPVTLNEIMAKGNFKSVLSLKAKLIRWKKRGVLFFQEQVAEMEMNQGFLYIGQKQRATATCHPMHSLYRRRIGCPFSYRTPMY